MKNFIIILLVAITCTCQAQANKTLHKTISLDGAEVIVLQLEGEVLVETTKGSRVILENTVSMVGTTNRADRVLDMLVKTYNVGQVEADLVPATNKKIIKVLRPTKVHFNSMGNIELTQAFKVLVPEGVAVEVVQTKTASVN